MNILSQIGMQISRTPRVTKPKPSKILYQMESNAPPHRTRAYTTNLILFSSLRVERHLQTIETTSWVNTTVIARL